MEAVESAGAASPPAGGDMAVVSSAAATGSAPTAPGSASMSGNAPKPSLAASASTSSAAESNGVSSSSHATISPPPALACLEAKDLEKQSASIKKALEKYQESQLGAQTDFMKLLEAFGPLLEGCPHERVRFSLCTAVSAASDGKKQSDAKLAELVGSASFRLNLISVDMQRMRQQQQQVASEGTHRPGAEESETGPLSGGGTDGAFAKANEASVALRRSVEEAADLVTNMVFHISDDLWRYSRKVGDSLQPFAQREGEGMSRIPYLYDLRDKWMHTTYDFHLLRSGPSMSRSELQALSVPVCLRSDEFRQAAVRFYALLKAYRLHLLQLMGLFPYTVIGGFQCLPKAVEAILKIRHCREDHAKVVAAARMPLSKSEDSSESEFADYVNFPLFVQGKREFEAVSSQVYKLSAAYQARRDAISELLLDSNRPQSPRAKSPDLPPFAVENASEILDGMLLAARPEAAFHQTRIAALLIFGRANLVTVQVALASAVSVTRDSASIQVRVPFLVTVMEDRAVTHNPVEGNLSRPLDFATFFAEYTTHFLPGHTAGPPMITFHSKEGRESVAVDRRSGLQQKIGKLAENVKRRTTSFSSKNSEQRRSKFYMEVGEEGGVVNGGDSHDGDSAGKVQTAQSGDAVPSGPRAGDRPAAPQPATAPAAGPAAGGGAVTAVAGEGSAGAEAAGVRSAAIHVDYSTMNSGEGGGWRQLYDYHHMDQNGVEDGSKFGLAAVDCLVARSLVPDQDQDTASVAADNSSSSSRDTARNVSASPNRIQSYSESSMAAQKEWERATMAGTYTQPQVPKGEEKRRARSDDKVCMDNEEKYGSAYPHSYYPAAAAGGGNGGAAAGARLASAYGRTPSSASQDTMTDRSNSSSSLNTVGAGSLGAGGGSGMAAERRRQPHASSDGAWEGAASSTAEGSVSTPAVSDATTTTSMAAAGTTEAAGSSPAAGAGSVVTSSSVQARASGAADSGDNSSGSSAEQGEAETGAAGEGGSTAPGAPPSAGCHSLHIDATGIKPTSALPSGQHGPFHSSFMIHDSSMAEAALSSYGGETVWSTNSGLAGVHTTIVEPPRVTSSISSENLEQQQQQATNAATLAAVGDVNATPHADKSAKPLSANMENLLPQDLFGMPVPQPDLDRTGSSSSVHSVSSGSVTGETYSDPAAPRNNPLARALNSSQQPMVKTSTWPMYKDKEPTWAIWEPQEEDASSQPDLRLRPDGQQMSMSQRSSAKDLSGRSPARSLAGSDAFLPGGQQQQHRLDAQMANDDSKMHPNAEPYSKGSTSPPPLPPRSERDRGPPHQQPPPRPPHRNERGGGPMGFPHGMQGGPPLPHRHHEPPPPHGRHGPPHGEHHGQPPPPGHPDHPHAGHQPPQHPADWHHGQYENHMPPPRPPPDHRGDERGPPMGPPGYPAPRPPPAWGEGHHHHQFRPRHGGHPPQGGHPPPHWNEHHGGWNPGHPRPPIPEHRGPPPGHQPHYDMYAPHHAPPPPPRHPGYNGNYGPPPEDRRPGSWERPSPRHDRGEYMPEPYYHHHHHHPGGPPPPQAMHGPRPAGPPHPPGPNYGPPPPPVPPRSGPGMPGPPPPNEEHWGEERWREPHYAGYHPSGSATM